MIRSIVKRLSYKLHCINAHISKDTNIISYFPVTFTIKERITHAKHETHSLFIK